LASTGVVREAVDPRRFPWIRPLVTDYATNFAQVAALFAGNPSDPAAWRDTIQRVTKASRPRDVVHAALVRQLERRGAPVQALEAAAELSRPKRGGDRHRSAGGRFRRSAYTVLKAVTAVQLARRVRETHGVPAVPVFWVETKITTGPRFDRRAVLDRDGQPASITATDPTGAGRVPVASLTFDPSIDATIAQLAEALPPTEFTADVLAALRASYRADTGVGTACAQWIERLLGHHGLVVFESNDVSLKPLAADLFAHEVATRRTGPLAKEAGALMTRLGHAPQVDPAEDSVALFYLDGSSRQPIRIKGDQLLIGETLRATADLEKEAREHPERFSPNVLLRPLVQDRIFPTACYVAGPAELAYQAQLGGVYREFGVEAPLLYSRASATLVDAGATRFLDRSGLPLEALQPQDDSALNLLLARELPAGLEQAMDEAARSVAAQVAALKNNVAAVDPTLAGAVDTTVDRMQDTLKTLHNKVVQAAKRKDDTLRRQFVKTRALVFPDGAPQERALSMVVFVNRYGLLLGDRLVESLPLETDKHYVLAL
jgi:bacillithiol biosynthesis cysteine-adding enzyme BshC